MTANVLIGADGIRSAVRKALFETAPSKDSGDGKTDFRQYIDATFTGIVSYCFLIPVEKLDKERPGTSLVKRAERGESVTSCIIPYLNLLGYSIVERAG